MPSKYNLRSREKMDQGKFKQLLADLYPSTYAKKQLKKGDSESESSESEYLPDSEEEEEEDDEETESEISDDESQVQVNITFTVRDGDDDESEYETEEEYDEKNSEFMKDVQAMGAELASKYKDTAMFKEYTRTHSHLVDKHKERVERATEREKQSNKDKFNKLMSSRSQNERVYFETLSIDEQRVLLEKLKSVRELDHQTKPVSVRILESSIPNDYKLLALQKLKQSTNGSDAEAGKYKIWLDEFIKIPFGVYEKLPVCMEDGTVRCSEFMKSSKKILDECTYGLIDAKMQILQYLGQLVSNPGGVGTTIALEGPMGTGKTTLVTKGISQILNRPVELFQLGGATDSSIFNGHMITYEGSVCGNIIKALMRHKMMNPVFYFDELDKISETPKGEEIVGLLTHLIDSSQNNAFKDNYFAGLDFDLSRAIFIFSYNDVSKVNPILRDRMTVIKTEGYTVPQKIIIAKNYLSPSIQKNIRFTSEDILLPDPVLQYVIETYTDNEKGVRNLKRCIETIYSKLNLLRLMPSEPLFDADASLKVEFPCTVTLDMVKKLIKMPNSGNSTPFMMYM